MDGAEGLGAMARVHTDCVLHCTIQCLTAILNGSVWCRAIATTTCYGSDESECSSCS